MNRFPIIEALPKEEQEPFSRWLYGQTCPLVENGTGYYPWDYERWKAGLPIVD